MNRNVELTVLSLEDDTVLLKTTGSVEVLDKLVKVYKEVYSSTEIRVVYNNLVDPKEELLNTERTIEPIGFTKILKEI